MSRTRTKITIDRQRVFARHGALPQESVVGASFLVSVEAETEDCAASRTDRLCDAVSYADMSRVVAEEMAVRSNLLEHVAGRIGERLMREHPSVVSLRVSVVKENPPLGVECGGAGVEITYTRE